MYRGFSLSNSHAVAARNHATKAHMYNTHHVTKAHMCNTHHVTKAHMCNTHHVTKAHICNTNHVAKAHICDENEHRVCMRAYCMLHVKSIFREEKIDRHTCMQCLYGYACMYAYACMYVLMHIRYLEFKHWFLAS
jgi:hypothetical protein